VRQVRAYGRKGEAIKADIRDIAALRRIADDVDRRYGRIDIVVADAAIQRWVPLLEMTDADWRDVIDNNLNGTVKTIPCPGCSSPISPCSFGTASPTKTPFGATLVSLTFPARAPPAVGVYRSGSPREARAGQE
jgi:hypothetical protein